MPDTILRDIDPVLCGIDHIGIACRNLDESIQRYREIFQLKLISAEVNEQQGVREAMLLADQETPAGTVPGAPASYVQLLEPLGPGTPVGRFLERRGEGLHHVGYRVADITSALARVADSGAQLIDSRPRHGSLGASIAFLHPASLGGVLTELVCPAPADAPASPPQTGGPGTKRIFRDA